MEMEGWINPLSSNENKGLVDARTHSLRGKCNGERSGLD